MNEAEVVAFLRGDQPLVMFDTNAIIGNHPRKDPFAALCHEVRLLNQQLAAGRRPIRFALSSVVLVEKLQDLREWRGARFDTSLVATFLANHEIGVFDFDRGCSERTAERITEVHPSTEAWHAFKRRRCLACLGLPKDHEAPGKGSGCGATIDWLVAGHAHHVDALLITHDQGPEFRSVTRKTTLDVLQRAVASLRIPSP